MQSWLSHRPSEQIERPEFKPSTNSAVGTHARTHTHPCRHAHTHPRWGNDLRDGVVRRWGDRIGPPVRTMGPGRWLCSVGPTKPTANATPNRRGGGGRRGARSLAGGNAAARETKRNAQNEETKWMLVGILQCLEKNKHTSKPVKRTQINQKTPPTG